MFEKAYFAENAKLFTLRCYFAPRPEKGTNLGADVLLTADPAPFFVPQICSQYRQFLFCSGSPERIEQMSMLHCYRVQKLTMKYQDKVS